MDYQLRPANSMNRLNDNDEVKYEFQRCRQNSIRRNSDSAKYQRITINPRIPLNSC